MYANGNATAYAPEWGDRTGDRWSFAFNRLPLLDNEGQEIRYTLAEEPVEYYDSSIEGTTITNRLVPPEASYISVNGVKTWNDQNDARGLRPQSIVVRLLQDGAVIQEQTVTGENGWSYQFEQLPESDGYGHTYVYSVSEQMVQGYYAQVDGYNITNTILPVQEGGDDHAKSPARRVPPFEKHTEEELEDFIDIFDYDVPLWGGLLSTGDETPAYPYIFAGIGIAALCVLCIFGRRRKQPKQ